MSEGLVWELRNFALADGEPSHIPIRILYLMRWFDVYLVFRAQQRQERQAPSWIGHLFWGLVEMRDL